MTAPVDDTYVPMTDVIEYTLLCIPILALLVGVISVIYKRYKEKVQGKELRSFTRRVALHVALAACVCAFLWITMQIPAIYAFLTDNLFL